MTERAPIENLLRELAPQVLGTLVRRYGDLADAEDAVQEALLAATTRWSTEGRPDNPRGWLTAVAARRLADEWRSDEARRRREELEPQAAIAAVHDEAPTAQQTDWPQILALYGVLERITDNPMVTLNRAVAVAMVHGPAAGLALLSGLDGRLAGHHRLDAVRAHLLEMAGDGERAIAHFRAAAGRTSSLAERAYLTAQAARLNLNRC